MECFRLLFDHLAWVEHQFLSGIRKPGCLWGIMRGVARVRKSIHQSWLSENLGLGLLCWGFKGVQEEIPTEEASTLEIGSVAFTAGQYTSPQIHPRHRLKMGIKKVPTLPIVQTLLPVTFRYSLSARKNLVAVVMRQLRRRKKLWRWSLTHWHKRTSMGPSGSFFNGTSAL